MTAVVGILNKSGIAIAADSAVTISTGGNERKIYNSANKIFTLSKYHPVSIMIYNSASFNGIPWEILIKEYRNQLKQKSFKTLQNYQSDFLKFIKKKINLIPSKIQSSQLLGFIDFTLSNLLETTIKENLEDIEKKSEDNLKFTLIRKLIRESIKSQILALKKEAFLIDFKNYQYSEFFNDSNELLNKVFQEYYSKLNVSSTDKKLLFQLVYYRMVSKEFYGSYTGLIFAGYGDDEIFPSILPIKISEVFNNRIRYYHDKENEVHISHSNSAAIRPFAQRDVIDLILSGVDNQIQRIIYGTIDDFLTDFIEKVSDTVKLSNKKLALSIKSIDVDEIMEKFVENIRQIQFDTHIGPLMSSIGTLSKEDLAELAESLIYLTYLKRRMSFSEESVGGPVDVAIITKGDGFIWLKRKHYFDPNKNHSFISNYLK